MTAAPTVGYAGMTHLGLCSAIAAASKGFEIVGFDPNSALVSQIGAGKLPVVEPKLDDLLRSHRAKISFTSEIEKIAGCDLIYVAPDLPTDDAGRSSLTELDRLLELVMGSAKPTATVVVLSQVPPGFTRTRQRSGRLLYYQVETLVFGNAVERATKPERFIIGCPDPDEELPEVLRRYLDAFDCPILPMRFESAELSKIAINCCLVASVSVANTLAELCEAIGADWSEIVPALKLDRRIGAYAYLAPGLGLAGGNLERDLATVKNLALAHECDAGVVDAWIYNSRHRRDWAARVIRRELLDHNAGATIAIWGLAYKENTHSVKNSPSIATISSLNGVQLRVHDPVVSAAAIGRPDVEGFHDPLTAAKNADALMILTPWSNYRQIAPFDIAKALRGKIVLDPYAVLDAKAARLAGLSYFTLGRPPAVPW